MQIHTIPLGPISSNMYVISEDGDFFIVDPSVSPEDVPEDVIQHRDLRAILITHGHYDHIAAIDEWIAQYRNVPVFMSSEDIPLLTDVIANCSYFVAADRKFSFDIVAEEELKRIFDEEYPLSLEVIETPGHTSGSVSFLITEKKTGATALFSGDFLFRGSIGRIDLPSGSYDEMLASLDLIRQYPADIRVFPGHGPETTIGQEKYKIY